MTTRKGAAALGCAALLVSGCATPGPLHLYSLAPGGTDVHDVTVAAQDTTRDVPSFLGADDQLTGFAYDPFTDHFFLRLAPGNHIRVVDRPARKIKREFDIGNSPLPGGDLAVSPRDGYLYLLLASGTEVVEATRLGRELRRIALDPRAPAAAIAYDPEARELVLLGHDRRTVMRVDLDGRPHRQVLLPQTVAPSLAFDPATRQLFAPLADDPHRVGVFGDDGHLATTVSVTSGDRFIDVGPHSFLRMF